MMSRVLSHRSLYALFRMVYAGGNIVIVFQPSHRHGQPSGQQSALLLTTGIH